MSTVVIDLKNAAEFFGGKLPKVFRNAAIRGLYAAAIHGVETIQTVIVPGRNPAPIDKGTYRAGWHASRIKGVGAEIWNDSPIASFVEYGVQGPNVKPGFAMVQALTEWVIRHGLVGGPIRGKSTKKVASRAAQQVAARGVAFAIIQRMKIRGIFNPGSRGLGILTELVNKYIDDYAHEEIEREFRKRIDTWDTSEE